MKKVTKTSVLSFCCRKMCFDFGEEPATQKRIVFDVGYEGKDSGTIGVNGRLEKNVVLDIALEILSLNKKS